MGFIPDYASMIGVIIKLQVQITLGYESPGQSDEFMSEDEIRSQMKKKKGKAVMEHFNPKFDGESEETATPKPLGEARGSIAQELSQMQPIYTQIISSPLLNQYQQSIAGKSNF